MYITILVKQVYWFISRVSGERLQDLWSSGYDLKKTLTPGVILTLPWGYIHAFYHSSLTRLLVHVYISGERLQDHWSSG